MAKSSLLIGVLFTLAAPLASAEAIKNACLQSERAAGQRTLCSCIQDAANRTLTARDQKLAASFFKDPNRAQDIRQSNARRHEDFWDRYENFGQVAETYCGR